MDTPLIIPHKKKMLRSYAFFGAIQLILGSLFFVFSDLSEFRGSLLGLGVFYIFIFFYMAKTPLLKIADGAFFCANKPFRKYKLEDLVQVKRFLDEITFVWPKSEVLISLDAIDESNQEALLDFVNQLQETISSSDSKAQTAIEINPMK